MEVYTNSSQVKELITTQTNIEVEPFDNHMPESKEVDVFLLDDHLLQITRPLQGGQSMSARNHVAKAQTGLGRYYTGNDEI